MLDAPLRKAASTVLSKLGTSIAIRRVTSTAYSTVTRSMMPVTQDFTVKGRLDEYTDRQLSDTVRAGDRKLTIAAADLTFEPTVDDQAVIAGTIYEVIRVMTELATDQAAIYVMQLRR